MSRGARFRRVAARQAPINCRRCETAHTSSGTGTLFQAPLPPRARERCGAPPARAAGTAAHIPYRGETGPAPSPPFSPWFRRIPQRAAKEPGWKAAERSAAFPHAANSPDVASRGSCLRRASVSERDGWFGNRLLSTQLAPVKGQAPTPLARRSFKPFVMKLVPPEARGVEVIATGRLMRDQRSADRCRC